jgi:hypothetical protein
MFYIFPYLKPGCLIFSQNTPEKDNKHNKFYVYFFVGYCLLYVLFQNVYIRVIYSSDVNSISSSSRQP